MKTLFFIAALVGAIYLVLQSPAGQAWLVDSEVVLPAPKKTPRIALDAPTVSPSKNREIEPSQPQNQQQTQIEQLENRIAQLENELINQQIAQQQTLNLPAQELLPEQEQLVSLPSSKGIPIAAENAHPQIPKTANKSSANDTIASNLQRHRQAKLQDIAEKMELSSLQVLVD
ncbi:DUF2730 domain-containing protein [Paraglaciecola aquimarina]|uniref:DUF2730 domain-containing protein n=1 Tax=Paraglaciecola aquimarina TaxID=1235557 RepID=A0ABU3T2E9_9ALTE|nr:DUF2730 domain-containing protein [Paraglaciecola aquimarina]MDU0356413.1 DUF2730 domain-containing protein [Paraglaciecola aquimarina]